MHNRKVQRFFHALKIQQIFLDSYGDFSSSGTAQSDVQRKAAYAIMRCKSGKLGCNASACPNCGHLEIHNNSCRNRSCPNCQAVQKEIWVERRRAETLLELSVDKRHLGAQPGIIQVLHTWNQEMLYHVHMHCIVSSGGLTPEGQIRRVKDKFFILVFILRDKFKGKYLALLDALWRDDKVTVPDSSKGLRDLSGWQAFKDSLYHKDWCPYIKETFNGFGNAIKYLGRYTHKIAISNSRILSVSETEVSFSARALKRREPKRTITIGKCEFIRRFLLHVLPAGFQKVRYYGFLNNRSKSRNLKFIFTLQGHQRFKERFAGMSMAELVKAVWKTDITKCPVCGTAGMLPAGRTYASG